jgi:hypothetical protein
MRGEDIQQHDLFSYGSLEQRVPADHPLRPIRTMVDEALQSLDGRFEEIYDEDGRKSIPPSVCCGHYCCRCSTRSGASGC